MNYPACREIQRNFEILSRALCPREIALVIFLVAIVARFRASTVSRSRTTIRGKSNEKNFLVFYGDDSRDNGRMGSRCWQVYFDRTIRTTTDRFSNIRNTRCFLKLSIRVLLGYRSMIFRNVWYFLKFLEFFVHSLSTGVRLFVRESRKYYKYLSTRAEVNSVRKVSNSRTSDKCFQLAVEKKYSSRFVCRFKSHTMSINTECF